MENTNDTLIKNGLMFIYARENKPVAEKIENIEKVLNDGAYINFPDANDNKNTVLHIATEREEKELVEFLLKRGAILINNLDKKTRSVGRTPLDIAKEKTTELGKEIFDILTKKGKQLKRIDVSSSSKLQKESNQNRSSKQLQPQHSNSNSPAEILYPKRGGTAGAKGQFYETKLLSLIFHRALHDKTIEEYYLAANISNIGDFDDVCFRFKMNENGKTKHVMCFTQAKHREDTDKKRVTVESVRGTSGQFRLVKYFDSFLKIKERFLTKSETYDPMFEGEFSDIDCYFIFYTPTKENFDRKLTENKPVCKKLHDFINTTNYSERGEGDIFQFDYEISDIDCLTKFAQQERIRVLGKEFLKSTLSGKTNEIMNIHLIKIYHPALARHVIQFSGDGSNELKWKFREDFFDSDDDLLKTLKETLCEEIVFKQTKTGLSKEEVKKRIKDIENIPSAKTISTLIGEVLYFDGNANKLCLDEKKISKKQYKQQDLRDINQSLQKCQVTQAIVNDAINIIGKEKLREHTFNLPRAFGNYDFPLNLKGEKIKQDKEKIKEEVKENEKNKEKVKEKEDRRVFLAKKFNELIKNAKKDKKNLLNPVEIILNDENVGPEKTLEIKHFYHTLGIAGTVGNLLQFDIETQTFRFNTNEESLGEHSKYILKELKQLTQDDLSNYKINVKLNNFPRTTFEANENDKELAREYLDKLWFYTNQSKEEAVETILKEEIDHHHNVDKSQNQIMFRVHSDAIFLRYHDEIQKWWKSSTQARYLTKTDPIFDEAKKDIIDSPVLTVLDVMSIRSLKKLDIEFGSHALNSMNLTNIFGNKKILNIITVAVILSANKIMQLARLKNNYTFVNLDYVHGLPENDYNKLMKELAEVKAVTLVIICETSLDKRLKDTLSKIIKIYNKKIIIITDKPLQETVYQNNSYVTFIDNNINLDNLAPKSQGKFLTEYKVCYQGKDVPLSTIIDNDSKFLIKAECLWAILNKTKIEIGQGLNSFKYDEIKDYYVNRSLLRNGEEYDVNTLYDIDDKIVLITSKPCMGKTILLTHLSLEAKKIDPKPWIVRINMSAHSNDFSEWKLHVTNIMRILCKAALKTTNTYVIEKLNFTQCSNQTVQLDRDDLEDGDISYELEWFIHFYNQGNVILLFDGFDKIHPHFTKEGIELLIALKQANKRMWITSNCYIVHILERELGASYKLEKLSTKEQESFLQRFWKTNLKLERLNHEQFNNISKFFNYVMKLFNSEHDAYSQKRPIIPLLSIPLHLIYLTAVDYFKNEINSLSPKFLRETLKTKWNLNSYTGVDRFLRGDEEKSLELAGTPLHMYIASNYFKAQITDTFELHLNTDIIIDKANVYINAISSYELFLKNNIKHLCEIKNRYSATVEEEQEKVREEFYAAHRKIALYAICKESDISKLLTEPEIREVKRTLSRIESGEVSSPFINSVVKGVPHFYNLLFAEYFLVEFASDLLKRATKGDVTHINLESLWNFIVNAMLTLCPRGVRNAFDYQLKYDPELAEVATSEKSDKILFDLILKQNKKSEIAGLNLQTCLDIAINEGLVNITNLFLRTARRHVTDDNVDGFLSIIKSGAFLVGAAKSDWKDQTKAVMQCIDQVNGKELIEMINSTEMEGVSETLSTLYTKTEMGEEFRQKVKKEICEPIKTHAQRVVDFSENNKNLTTLLEVLPYHLPAIINFLFHGEKKEEEMNFQEGHPSSMNFEEGHPSSMSFQEGHSSSINFHGGHPSLMNFQGGDPSSMNFQEEYPYSTSELMHCQGGHPSLINLQTDHPSSLNVQPGPSSMNFQPGYSPPMSFQEGFSSPMNFQGGHPSPMNFQGGHSSSMNFQGGHSSSMNFQGGHSSSMNFQEGYSSSMNVSMNYQDENSCTTNELTFNHVGNSSNDPDFDMSVFLYRKDTNK